MLILIVVCTNTEYIAVNERLIAGRSGLEFPPHTKTIKWPFHNVSTFMPFTGGNCEKDMVSAGRIIDGLAKWSLMCGFRMANGSGTWQRVHIIQWIVSIVNRLQDLTIPHC